jgi:hypothetical protein
MLKKSASGVLASLRGSTYRNVRLASSLAAALLDGLFEHPAECTPVVLNVQASETPACPQRFSPDLLRSYLLHNHHTLKPCRIVDQPVKSEPGYLVDNPSYQTSLTGTNFHDHCAAGSQVSTGFL